MGEMSGWTYPSPTNTFRVVSQARRAYHDHEKVRATQSLGVGAYTQTDGFSDLRVRILPDSLHKGGIRRKQESGVRL